MTRAGTMLWTSTGSGIRLCLALAAFGGYASHLPFICCAYMYLGWRRLQVYNNCGFFRLHLYAAMSASKCPPCDFHVNLAVARCATM